MNDAATRIRRTAAATVGALAGSVLLADAAAAHTEADGAAHSVAAPAHLLISLAVFVVLSALAAVVAAVRRSARTRAVLAAAAGPAVEQRLAEA